MSPKHKFNIQYCIVKDNTTGQHNNSTVNSVRAGQTFPEVSPMFQTFPGQSEMVGE